MKIVHVHFGNGPIPPPKYGGTERIIWNLAKHQRLGGHNVVVLAKNWSGKETAVKFRRYDPNADLNAQIGRDVDIVHFHSPGSYEIEAPYICTEHGQSSAPVTHHKNTVYLSKSHAHMHHASFYIYNGLDWEDYDPPDFGQNRTVFHFLGKTDAPQKNLRGAIALANRAGRVLYIMGNRWHESLRLNRHRYFGRVTDAEKGAIIARSLGMLAPIRWHEPFGLAMVESLYYGAPVFGTPLGSLPELVRDERVGMLSMNADELLMAMQQRDRFDSRICHELAVSEFNAAKMSDRYIEAYDRVIRGLSLQPEPPHTDGSAGKLRDPFPA
ncbi:MAG: glycosyltransferase [Halieaceae bacterium]